MLVVLAIIPLRCAVFCLCSSLLRWTRQVEEKFACRHALFSRCSYHVAISSNFTFFVSGYRYSWKCQQWTVVNCSLIILRVRIEIINCQSLLIPLFSASTQNFTLEKPLFSFLICIDFRSLTSIPLYFNIFLFTFN